MRFEGFQEISPSDDRLSYCGRIDREDKEAPVFVYPCSNVRFRMNGKIGKILAENIHSYYENAVGILVDGCYKGKLTLPESKPVELDFSCYLDGGMHEITIYKLMDGCHYFVFRGLLVEADARLESAEPAWERRIEVYGDSVSAGEVSEAVDRVGMPDPENHNGMYSNSFYSYSWIAARKLKAQLHDIAQGGISLLDGQGYFDMPDTIGMFRVYDKIEYCPGLGEVKQWDFSAYIPHVVIVAIGQNDAHPYNYMAEDYEGEQAVYWRKRYGDFVGILREKYPLAHIILTTTILMHDSAWDRAIGEVAESLGDRRVHHFLYSQNGSGTPGHIRIPEAEQMAEELAAFIETLEMGWQEE